MPKYNSKKVSSTLQTVTNLQGGQGYAYDEKSELLSILATGMTDTFYEKEDERAFRLKTIIEAIAKTPKGVEFIAKALVHARSVHGQRSVTHYGAGVLVKYLSGVPELGRRFFSKRDRNQNRGGIVYRVDDMLEILSVYFHLNPNAKTVPNSMKKGFAEAIQSSSRHELAKYQGKSRSISLVDVFNLVHPKPDGEAQTLTFKELMNGGLLVENTHEAKNSEAGREIAKKVATGLLTKEEATVALEDAKANNWKELLESKKLGYFALLRNLRNITQVTDDDIFGEAMRQLVDENSIRKSLVFPHQIDIAISVLVNDNSLDTSRRNTLLQAVNTAYELAIPNMASAFEGRTAIAVDTSGSMTMTSNRVKTDGGATINATPAEKACLMGATFAKAVGADLYQYASSAKHMKYNPMDSCNTIKNNLLGVARRSELGHGTDFGSVFSLMMKDNKKYDRIFFLSDMQGYDEHIHKQVASYAKKYGRPFIYAVNLVGYGTTMFNPKTPSVFQLFGYSSATYGHAKLVEMDKEAIFKEIEEIVI